MKKNILRNLGLVLTVAAFLAAPTASFADDIVGGGNPDPGNGSSSAVSTMNAVTLVIALATA